MNRDEFMSLGEHCSLTSCNQIDFLPFKCPCCKLPFCGDHWHPSQRPSDHDHLCSSFDPVAADNRIPSCPLCAAPVSFKVGTDPNIAMDSHLSTACHVLHPSLAKRKAPKAANICASKGCKTKMIQPIHCGSCGKNHCTQHRFEKDHACAGKQAPPKVVKAAPPKAMAAPPKGPSGSAPKPVVGKTSLSGLAALRRAQSKITSKIASDGKGAGTKLDPIIISDSEPSDSDVEIISPAPAAAGSTTAHKGVKALASVGVGRKVDVRAEAEQRSAMKGLEARAKKGLLSEDEKIRYATLQALDAKKGNRGGKEGCTMS